MFSFKISTLKERREFYEKEFSIDKVKSWFEANMIKLPQICAFDAGTHSGIFLDEKFRNKLFYLRFEDIMKKIEKYYPEGVYYDRNVYENPDKVLDELNFENPISQELAFDIDVDNIKDVEQEDGKEYEKILEEAHLQTLKMKEELEKEFKKVLAVYSGRGFHLHVIDKKAYALTNAERQKLSERFSKIYPIDPWVSRGYIRLIRMPYSLNGIVSRIVTPMDRNDFNKEKIIPKFLKK